MVPKAITDARQRGRKGECHVIKITKNRKKTKGYCRQLKEKAGARGREGDRDRVKKKQGIGGEGDT